MPSGKPDVHLITRFIEELGKATGDFTMPSQQQLLLLALYTHGELQQQGLERFTGVKRSSNSRNITRLGIGETPWSNNGPGWVESFEDLRDRRNKMVRLTPKGRKMIDSVMATLARLNS